MLSKSGPHKTDSSIGSRAAREAFDLDFSPIGTISNPRFQLLDRPIPDEDPLREERLRRLHLRAQAVAASAGLVHIFNHFTAFNLAHRPHDHPPASARFLASEDRLPPSNDCSA